MAPKSRAKPPKAHSAQASAHAPVDPSFGPPPELELKDLASKARQETWSKLAAQQASLYLRSAALLGLAAVYCNVSQLALSPLYGSIPASAWHSWLVMAACFVGWSANLLIRRILSVRPQRLLPVVAAYVPVAQCLLGRLSGPLTASWGPLVVEALTLFPLAVLSVACTADELEGVELGALPGWIADAAPGLGAYGVFRAAERASAAALQEVIGSSLAFTRVGLQAVLATGYGVLAPSRLLLWALPGLLHTALLDPHLATARGAAAVNGTLESSGWVLLDRRESRTGYVSVVESLGDGFRLLRCDHSLLGGEWVKFRGAGRFEGNAVAEPIYGVFTMLEAVRLVRVPEPVPDAEAAALVMYYRYPLLPFNIVPLTSSGMGVGTTPAALVAHGIDTTVVEIDPVVHQFAVQYFQVPANHTPVIADAVSYTAQLAEAPETWDYIVHDVFTGGAEPVELFTLEFLQGLHTLLKPSGVVAINYAGDFALPPPGVVVRTVRAVFPSCRVFREHPRDEAVWEREGRDFANMVIFCTKQSSSVAFREAVAADLLNSPTREAFLLPRHEVGDADLQAGEGVLRRNETGKLERWHRASAVGHWGIMRTVVPAAVWEGW